MAVLISILVFCRIPNAEAASQKGGDFANHVVRFAIDLAQLRCKSVAVLYLDLSKAFDWDGRKIVRLTELICLSGSAYPMSVPLKL